MMTSEIACEHCGVLFLRSQSDLDTGRYKFCSEKCDTASAMEAEARKRLTKSAYSESDKEEMLIPVMASFAVEQTAHLESSNALLARKVEILEKCAEHYQDANRWGCDIPDPEHSGRCIQRLYLGNGRHGYTIANQAIAEAARIDEKGEQNRPQIT